VITRFALFEGTVGQERTEAFRAAILEEVLPHWKSFPGVLSVRISFENERDEGAPELPLILAITYPNRAAVDVALASPERALAKAATPNPSLKLSPNGGPPGPGRRYAVHCLRPGPGVPPLVPT